MLGALVCSQLLAAVYVQQREGAVHAACCQHVARLQLEGPLTNASRPACMQGAGLQCVWQGGKQVREQAGEGRVSVLLAAHASTLG